VGDGIPLLTQELWFITAVNHGREFAVFINPVCLSFAKRLRRKMPLKRLFPLFAFLIIILTLLAFNAQPFASAQEPAPANGVDEATVSALQAKIATEGELNLIVGLTLAPSFQAEGLLSPTAVAQQRADIAQAQKGLSAELAPYNATIYHIYTSIPALALKVDKEAFNVLRQSKWVNHLQEDIAVPHTLASSTPVIGTPAVWASGFDGTGQTVVILDTGIDGDHPFFKDDSNTSRIVTEACFSNANGAGGQTTLCPNGSPTQTGPGASEADIPACNNGALCNHGSHVAGIAAGNGATFDGVARNAGIISIQVFTRFNSGCPSNPCVRSYTSDQLAALDYIYTTLNPLHTIASVNMSLGGGGPFIAHCDAEAIKPAIDQLRSVGIATIIATGNNSWTNGINSPACISTAVAVGSTTDGDAVSIFSNVHDIMDLFAPGSAIESSVVGGGFANFNGTSMAAPHVAGAWAALKQANPTASVDDILTLLATTGVSVTDGRAGGTFTKPRIQLDAALAQLLTNAWTGAVDTDWHNVGNWSHGAIPTCAANVTIPDSLSNYPTITANATASNLILQSGAQLNMSDHTLTLCGNLDVQGTANFNMSGGTLLLGRTLDAMLNLPASNKQLHHLQLGNGADRKQVTLNSDIEIAGNFAISNQTVLASNGQEIRFNGAVAQLVDIAGLGIPHTVYSNNLSVFANWTVNNAEW
jgi:subtilisin